MTQSPIRQLASQGIIRPKQGQAMADPTRMKERRFANRNTEAALQDSAWNTSEEEESKMAYEIAKPLKTSS